MKGLLVALIVLASASNTQGQDNPEMNVQKFLSWCQSTKDTPLWAYCLGELKGMSTAMIVAGDAMQRGQMHGGGVPAMCVGSDANGPSGAALLQAFLNYATAHPEEWGSVDGVAIMDAFETTWPCPAN